MEDLCFRLWFHSRLDLLDQANGTHGFSLHIVAIALDVQLSGVWAGLDHSGLVGVEDEDRVVFEGLVI
jgi:hypothetical protein